METGGAQFRDKKLRRPVVITTCSSYKRFPATVKAQSLKRGSQRHVATQWLGLLSDAESFHIAQELYFSRAFKLARTAAQRLGADLLILSAGLGLVRADASVPSYDLTFARGGIRSKVCGDFSIADWWLALTSGPYSTSWNDELKDRACAFLCLSHAYAEAVRSQLESIPIDRLRIFGDGLERRVPSTLAESVMPYDQRLNQYLPGTRHDFAQRALMHYVELLGDVVGDNLVHDRQEVQNSLRRFTARISTTGAKVSDAVVKRKIRQLLPIMGKNQRVMLQHIRRNDGLACEQTRFARLFKETVHD